MNLVVLDYSTSTVHYFNIPTESDDDYIEEFLKSKGLKESNCEYMFADVLTIINH